MRCQDDKRPVDMAVRSIRSTWKQCSLRFYLFINGIIPGLVLNHFSAFATTAESYDASQYSLTLHASPTHQVHLIHCHLQLPSFVAEQRSPSPIHADILPVLEPIIYSPVDHHLIAVVTKWIDLLEMVFSLLHRPRPQSFAQLKYGIMSLHLLRPHDHSSIFREAVSILFMRGLGRVVAGGVEGFEEFGDARVDGQGGGLADVS